MNAEVIRVEVLGVFPTEQQTLAIFVGNQEKCFVIHVEPVVGRAIAMSMRGERSERPLTHELVGLIFQAFDVALERVVINDLRSNTYFARLMLKAENEIHTKHVEIDARPSDSIALALQAEAPIYVSDVVWDEVDDRSEELEKIKQALRDKQLGLGGSGGSGKDPFFDDDEDD
ncbi:MAG: bifunctional nuclease family protein [Verrucomicrobiota bacterium]